MKIKTMVKVLLWSQVGFWGNILITGGENNIINIVSVWAMLIFSIILAFNLDKLKDK